MEEEGAAAALLFRQSLQHPESTTKTTINADKLLAHALNGLSIQDRERVYDEIHGINCGPNKKHSNTKHGSRLSISSNASNTDNSKSSSGNISVASFQSIKEQRKQEEDEALCQLQEEVDIILAASSASSASASSPAAATVTVTVTVAVAPAQSLYPAYRYALAQGSPLLSDRQFQLSFLRTEGYNQPRKAAVRFLKHLETLPDVFDTTAVLFRPLQLTDLDADTTIDLHPHSGTDTSTTTANKQHGTNKTPENTDTNKCTKSAGMTKQPSMLEQGFFQVLPVRDSSGRRILCRFRPPIGTDNIKAWQRYLYYISQTVADDPNGCILIFFLHKASDRMRNPDNPDEIRWISKFVETQRLLFYAIHVLFPAGPLYDAVKTVYTLIFRKTKRSRIRFHTGSYQECLYSLKSFGIPVERLPPDGFGKKSEVIVQRENRNHRKWIAMQKALETKIAEHVATKQQQQHQHLMMSLNSSAIEMEAHNTLTAYNTVRAKYVECAYHEDILFGKGLSAMKHPGNMGFRRLLEEKYNLYNYDLYPDQHIKTKIAMEIVQEIKCGSGRFLKEVETDQGKTMEKGAMAGSGLLVAVDDKVALQKFKTALRDLRRRKQLFQDRAAEQRDLRKAGTKNTITARGPKALSHRRLKNLTTSLVKSSFTTSIENVAQLNTTSIDVNNEDNFSVGTFDANNEDDEYLPLPLDCQDPPLTSGCCDVFARAIAVGVGGNNAAAVLPPHRSIHGDMYNSNNNIKEQEERQCRQNKAQKLHRLDSPNTADDDDDGMLIYRVVN